MSRAACALCCLVCGCSSSATSSQGPKAAVVAQMMPARATTGGGGEEVFVFPEATAAPRPVAAVPSGLAPFFEQCRLGDAALSRVAERLARRQTTGSPPLEASEISFALRAEGSPYVWPRTWRLEGGDLQGAAAVERLRGWLDSWGDGGERRCGMALITTQGRSVLSAVGVDALADLEPIPVRLHAGAWVDVSATLLVPAGDAKLIVLGPSGAPFAVPTSFDGRQARARFHADRPGSFVIQLLASVAGGPRPVLEATVYADVEPPTTFVGEAAPGEPHGPFSPGVDQAGALFSMVNEARATEQSPALLRDGVLDTIAQHHAEAMRELKRIAHDAGDGDPQTRVQASDLDVLWAGENVAHALDVTRAHRALWASPSHRENLLQPRFDKIGIGVANDADGSVWVCELFADFPEATSRPPRP